MTFKQLVSWVAFSSKNPEKVSLTLKGALVGISTIAIYFFPTADFSTVVDSVVTLVQQSLAIVSTIMVVVGGIRKVVRSIRGDNAVLNKGGQD